MRVWGPLVLGTLLAAGAAAPASAQLPLPEGSAIKNVELIANVPEAANATAIDFVTYGKKDRGHGRWDWNWDWRGGKKDRGGKDVMLVTGRFGLKSYDLSDPAKPKFLDEITAEELRLPG